MDGPGFASDMMSFHTGFFGAGLGAGLGAETGAGAGAGGVKEDGIGAGADDCRGGGPGVVVDLIYGCDGRDSTASLDMELVGRGGRGDERRAIVAAGVDWARVGGTLMVEGLVLGFPINRLNSYFPIPNNEFRVSRTNILKTDTGCTFLARYLFPILHDWPVEDGEPHQGCTWH